MIRKYRYRESEQLRELGFTKPIGDLTRNLSTRIDQILFAGGALRIG